MGRNNLIWTLIILDGEMVLSSKVTLIDFYVSFITTILTFLDYHNGLVPRISRDSFHSLVDTAFCLMMSK